MANRRCEQCGGAVPDRMSRQRNQRGQLVCEECKRMNLPEWNAGTAHSSLDVRMQSEMRRREAQAIVAISKIARLQREGHDSGDGAVINHCPFCGSGAVTKRNDGSAECDFCNNVFTVQVQPSNPNMPQTVDGQPVIPPGMPAGQEGTEISGTDDPAVAEDEDGVATNPLDDQGPASNGPVAPGQPPSQQPKAPAKADPATNPGKGNDQPPWLKNKTKPGQSDPKKPGDSDSDGKKKKSLPPWLKKKTSRDETAQCKKCSEEIEETPSGWVSTISGGYDCPQGGVHVPEPSSFADKWASHSFRTASGAEVDAEAYMAHLALRNADDREVVLDMVRVANTQRQAAMPPFEAAGGLTHHHVRATEVREGDYLDVGGKVRVHKTLTRDGRTTLAYRLRGSKAPGVRSHTDDEMVHVWRRG